MDGRLHTIDLLGDSIVELPCKKCETLADECFTLMAENSRLKAREQQQQQHSKTDEEKYEVIFIENQHLRDLINHYKEEKKKDESLIHEVIEQSSKLQKRIEKLQDEQDGIVLNYEKAHKVLIDEKHKLKIKITELLDWNKYQENIEKVYSSAASRQSTRLRNQQSIQDMLLSACDFYDHNYGTLNGKYWKCSYCQKNCHASEIYKHSLICMKIQQELCN
jgi:septal ring factor EnvC (AmiA/AmiB activator)